MAKDTKIKDLNYYTNWLEELISKKQIKLYENSDFKNFQQIGRGSYGNVVRVNWKNTNSFFALKSFINNKQPFKELVKEVLIIIVIIVKKSFILNNLYIIGSQLKLHRSVNDHENIIRLYGITKVEVSKYYRMRVYCIHNVLSFIKLFSYY